MKKMLYILITLLLLMSLTACNKSVDKSIENADVQSGEETATDADNADDKEQEQTTTDDKATNDDASTNDEQSSTEPKTGSDTTWPKEAIEMAIPELKGSTIVSANVVPTSMSQYKRNLIMEMSAVTQDMLDAFKADLEAEGFVIGVAYPVDTMMNYVKKDDKTDLDIILTYDPETKIASMIAVDKTSDIEAADYVAEAGTTSEGIPSEVPELTSGELIDTTELDMGDNTFIYTLKYKNITQAQVDAYEQELVKAGFEKVYDSYQKIDETGVNMVMVGLEFDGEFLMMTTGKVSAAMDDI